MDILTKLKLTGILTRNEDGLTTNSLYKVLDLYAKRIIYPTVQAPNFIQIPIQPTPPAPYPTIVNQALKYLRVNSAADGVEWVNILPTFDHRDTGKALVVTGSTTLGWANILPTYDSSTTGKFLCFDGENLAWSEVPYIPEINPVTDNNKILAVNSGVAAWININTVPTPIAANQYLKTSANNESFTYSWGSLVLPTWANSTARPANPVTGTIGVNLDTATVECYIGSAWVDLNPNI